MTWCDLAKISVFCQQADKIWWSLSYLMSTLFSFYLTDNVKNNVLLKCLIPVHFTACARSKGSNFLPCDLLKLLWHTWLSQVTRVDRFGLGARWLASPAFVWTSGQVHSVLDRSVQWQSRLDEEWSGTCNSENINGVQELLAWMKKKHLAFWPSFLHYQRSIEAVWEDCVSHRGELPRRRTEWRRSGSGSNDKLFAEYAEPKSPARIWIFASTFAW